MKMKKYEKIALILVLLTLTILASSLKIIKWNENQGDTTFIYELTENIADSGIPTSKIAQEILYLFGSNLLTMTPEEVKQSPLTPPVIVNTNYFHTHAYFILYLFAPLNWIVPTNILLPILTVLSFIGLLFLAYIMLRKNNISIITSILFCILVISHPAWSQAIQGQIYADRFFLFLGLFFIYLFTNSNPRKLYIIIVGFLCLIIHERTGLIIGIFATGYTILFWKMNIILRRFRLLAGITLIVLSTILRKLYIRSTAYESFMPANIADIQIRFQDPIFLDKLYLFLLVNLIALGVIAVFNWRAALLALTVMLPNILGSLGGAEKVGWSTHYHSYYFPVLIWAAVLGLIKLKQLLRNVSYRQIYVSSLLIVLLFITIGLNPYDYSKLGFSSANANFNILYKGYKDIPLYYGDYGKSLLDAKNQVLTAIPENSNVSAPEALMPILYKNRQVHYYPIGIDSADYAVLAILGQNELGNIYGGATNYTGQENVELINKDLFDRMKHAGFDVENPTLVPFIGVAVFKKSHIQ